MHATSASQAIERIANLTPEVEKTQRLYNLSNVLKVIIGQRLIPSKDGGMTLAMDILRNDGFIKPLIADGKIGEIRDLMQRNSDIGMMTFDTSLMQLHKDGIISEETAVLFADQPENLKLELLKKTMSIGNSMFPGSPLNKHEF
jgi:twitching motility protein PilU